MSINSQALLLFSGLFLANPVFAQKFGFDFVTSQCELNHGVLATDEISKFVQEDERESQINFLKFDENLIVKIKPVDLDEQKHFEFHIEKNAQGQLYSVLQTVNDETKEVQTYSPPSDEPKNAENAAGAMNSLVTQLLEIVSQSESKDLNYHALFLADCEAGICFPDGSFDRLGDVPVAPVPDYLKYEIAISRKDVPNREVKFRLDKGLLGQLNAIRADEEKTKVPSPFIAHDPMHRLCLHMNCEDRNIDLDTQTPEFKDLELRFNRFSRHLHIWLNKARHENDNQN